MRIRSWIRAASGLYATVACYWLLESRTPDAVYAFIGAAIVFLGTFAAQGGSHEPSEIVKDDAAFDSIYAEKNEKNESEESKYAKEVGSRMRMIRTSLIGLSKREMSEFLALDEVSLLEEYETGTREFPIALLKKLERHFFLRKRYVGAGEGSINKQFSTRSESFGRFLDEGFSPCVACRPDSREDLFAYIFMEKVTRDDQGGWNDCIRQVAVASNLCSFMSSGGGKANVVALIRAMLDRDIDPMSTSIFTADVTDWHALENGCYFGGSTLYRPGRMDAECIDIFFSWCQEIVMARDRIRQREMEYRDDA